MIHLSQIHSNVFCREITICHVNTESRQLIEFSTRVPSNQKSGSTLQNPFNDLQYTYKGPVAVSQMGKEQHRKVKCFVVKQDNSGCVRNRIQDLRQMPWP